MTDKHASEFDAFQKVYDALVALDEETRVRVLSSVSTLLGIEASVAPTNPGTLSTVEETPQVDVADPEQGQAFTEFAELYAAADLQTSADKALLAGYWLQVCQCAENFSGQSVNKELNHLGHKIPNITNALSALNDTKPQLVLQLRKSGKSQQARKTYKLSAEGISPNNS